MNLRFDYIALSSLFYTLRVVPRANYMLRHRERYTNQDLFEFAKKIIDHMRRRGRITTKVYGKENIPIEDGYVLYSNHQGKYDALGILLSLDTPCGALWEKRQAKRFLSRHVCRLTDAVQIDLEDNKEKAKAILEATKKVSEGKNMLVFPEGKYDNNQNELQPFQSGCFHISLHSKKPLVPVVIYDSYKAMNSNTFEPVTTQVHFLPAIHYEEYGHLNKKQLCEMVQKLIADKLQQIEAT